MLFRSDLTSTSAIGSNSCLFAVLFGHPANELPLLYFIGSEYPKEVYYSMLMKKALAVGLYALHSEKLSNAFRLRSFCYVSSK